MQSVRKNDLKRERGIRRYGETAAIWDYSLTALICYQQQQQQQ